MCWHAEVLENRRFSIAQAVLFSAHHPSRQNLKVSPARCWPVSVVRQPKQQPRAARCRRDHALCPDCCPTMLVAMSFDEAAAVLAAAQLHDCHGQPMTQVSMARDSLKRLGKREKSNSLCIFI